MCLCYLWLTVLGVIGVRAWVYTSQLDRRQLILKRLNSATNLHCLKVGCANCFMAELFSVHCTTNGKLDFVL